MYYVDINIQYEFIIHIVYTHMYITPYNISSIIICILIIILIYVYILSVYIIYIIY